MGFGLVTVFMVFELSNGELNTIEFSFVSFQTETIVDIRLYHYLYLIEYFNIVRGRGASLHGVIKYYIKMALQLKCVYI